MIISSMKECKTPYHNHYTYQKRHMKDKAIMNKNRISVQFPELAREWHPTKNGDLRFSDMTSSSGRKVWWVCSEGHEWEARIADRTSNHGCPYCAGKKVLPGVNDLQTLFPTIAEEWNYQRNQELQPHSVTAKSHRKVWWICSKGHEWESTVKNRTLNESKCPYCSGKLAISGENDIATKFPNLMKEWNFERNIGVNPSQQLQYSNRKVWWKGPCGHEWQDTITHRTQGRGCPICNKQNRTSFPEQAIFFYVKRAYPDSINAYMDIFSGTMELDIFIPSLHLGIEYDGKAWHGSKAAYEREKKKYQICREKGIKLIRVKENKSRVPDNICDVLLYTCDNIEDTINLLSEYLTVSDIDISRDRQEILAGYLEKRNRNSLTEKYPSIAEQWNYSRNGSLKPEMFFAASGEVVWWLCDKGHEWQMAIRDRTTGGNGCPFCSHHRLQSGFNDLATLAPWLVSEWNTDRNGGVSPENVKARSVKKAWWQCNKGHEWQAAIRKRVDGENCPICSKKTVRTGVNDLFTTHPHLASEWDAQKNSEIDPSALTSGSREKAWWICSICGNRWEAPIANRAHGSACPKCAYKIAAKKYMATIAKKRGSVAEADPTILSEWIEKEYSGIDAQTVPISSNKKYHWRCNNCGWIWLASPNSRIVKKAKCPKCRNHRRGLQVSENALKKNGSLADSGAGFLNEWDYEKNGDLSPADVTVFSTRLVWWRCQNNHEWEAKVSSRSYGGGCPYCASRRVLSGFNDLQHLYPEIAKEWDYAKNEGQTPDKVMAHSSKNVWWKCSKCGYEWLTAIHNRTKGHGCPVCAGNIVVPGINDLFTLHPELKAEWSSRNTDIDTSRISINSRKMAWWICTSCGREWEDTVKNKMKKKKKCPACMR